jgi:hypothetical protein
MALSVLAPPAVAGEYSGASEVVYPGGDISGVRATRADINRNDNEYWYQTQLIEDVDNPTWGDTTVEIGTANCPGVPSLGCNTGVGYIPDWHWYGFATWANLGAITFTRPVGPGIVHNFYVYWVPSIWVFTIDTTVVDTEAGLPSTWGDLATVALERFNPFGYFGIYTSYNLAVTRSVSAWQPFVPPNQFHVGTPNMCGYYVSNTAWTAGQPSSLC